MYDNNIPIFASGLNLIINVISIPGATLFPLNRLFGSSSDLLLEFFPGTLCDGIT
jgi:hypothetical protein